MATNDYVDINDISYLLKNTHCSRDNALIYTLFYSRRMLSEIRYLKVGDISFEGNTITWNLLQKHKEVKITTHENPELIMRLRAYLEEHNLLRHPEAYVFPSPKKGFMHFISRDAIDKFLKKYSEELGIRTVGRRQLCAKCFRYSFNRWYVGQIKNMLGRVPDNPNIRNIGILHNDDEKQIVGWNVGHNFWKEAEVPF